jgi:hypothetical protein
MVRTESIWVILNYKFTGGHTTVVKDCCEGSPLGIKPRFRWIDDFINAYQFIDNTRTSQIDFAAMTPPEQQAMVNIWLHEIFRHLEDIHRSWKELEYIEQKYGLKAMNTFVSTWIQILPKEEK